MKQTPTLLRGETPTLEKIPVENFLVTIGEKFSSVARTDSALCPHCSKTAEGLDSVIKEFGLRNMDDVTRVQSWCKDCRNKSQKVNGRW